MHHRIVVYCDVDNEREREKVYKLKSVVLVRRSRMRLIGHRRLPVAPEQMGVLVLVCPQPTGIAYAPVKAKIASNKRIQRDDMMMDDLTENKRRRAMWYLFLG